MRVALGMLDNWHFRLTLAQLACVRACAVGPLGRHTQRRHQVARACACAVCAVWSSPKPQTRHNGRACARVPAGCLVFSGKKKGSKDAGNNQRQRVCVCAPVGGFVFFFSKQRQKSNVVRVRVVMEQRQMNAKVVCACVPVWPRGIGKRTISQK